MRYLPVSNTLLPMNHICHFWPILSAAVFKKETADLFVFFQNKPKEGIHFVCEFIQEINRWATEANGENRSSVPSKRFPGDCLDLDRSTNALFSTGKICSNSEVSFLPHMGIIYFWTTFHMNVFAQQFLKNDVPSLRLAASFTDGWTSGGESILNLNVSR